MILGVTVYRKELPLGLNAAVVTSFGLISIQKVTVMASYMPRNLKLENEISREPDEVFKNGQWCSSDSRRLLRKLSL